MNDLKGRACALLLAGMLPAAAWADSVRGKVVDSSTGEALAGATVMVEGTKKVATTDADGLFEVKGLRAKPCAILIKYISYKNSRVVVNPAKTDTVVVVPLETAFRELAGATVKGAARRNTENAVVAATRASLVVQNGVSAQQIAKTQDKNASEVIRRVPGISIIDQRFVMVRGLAQRYNNVWINGAAVPSTEPDSRAFSFDVLPSGQIDNMQVVKSPAPQYPADFSGGFIAIETKDVPEKNSFSVGAGGTVNDRTHFRSFLAGKSSATDFLGFDNGLRSLRGGMGASLPTLANGGIDLLRGGFNNDWTLRRFSPVADFSLNADLNRVWRPEGGATVALLAALTYSNAYKTYSPMENSLFGAYDVTHDRSNYLRKSIDHQYNHDVRLGAMLNLTLLPSGHGGKYEWKNIFNQLAKDRYTTRSGLNAQNNQEFGAEYFYSSRTTYNTQLSARYAWDDSRLKWNAGYAYANRNLPDRRRYVLDNALDAARVGLTTGNDINREYTRLDEHLASAALDYERTLSGTRLAPKLLAGAYGEYRSRSYKTRSFIYAWNAVENSLPADFRYMDVPTELMRDGHYGADGLYLLDDTKKRNDYDGKQLTASGYVAANVPLGPVAVYAGVRYEHHRTELVSNTRDDVKSPKSKVYDYDDLFPSLNTTWKLDAENQLRLSYGRSINRAEFRELSTSVFYDFDLASSVQGNPDLKPCHVDNLDLRYEWYPAEGDQISLAAFFKHFDAPIEWTYTVAGGTDLVYSYQNADKATAYGLELDVRKDLSFMGLRHFTLVFNGSLIKSRVHFAPGSRYEDRPMQGQSPYLVNAGLFYAFGGWNAALLYNRVGKRLLGVGRSLGSTGDQTVKIPDSYEMPRNTVDVSASRAFGRWTVKLAVKDLLAEKVFYKQFNDVTRADGSRKTVEEVTRAYRPGRSVSLSLSCAF